MNVIDLVLFNDCGCEIARETISVNRTKEDILTDWDILPGDKIEVQEVWVEI